MLFRALLLALAVLPAAAWGQGIPPDSLLPGAGFAWEPIGDRGINARGFAFSPGGTIWSAGADFNRLDPTTGVWTQLSNRSSDAVVVLPAATPGADTVVVNGSGRIYRSTNGGQTLVEVLREGGLALRADGPPGLLLAGTGDERGVWRSYDRGVTWLPAAYPDANANAQADAILPLSPTPERPSWRVLAGGPHGVTASTDSARTFHTTGLWGVLQYYVDELAAIEGPTGARRVLAGGARNAQPYARVWASDDDGATWAEAARLRDVADGG